MTASTAAAAPTSPAWLTVVMPLHDGADWLSATLQSLVDEPAGGFEIVAIDSTADDRTRAVAARFADRLPMRILHRPDMKPWPAKTNLAVELAETDHVCMLHQDDLWLPGRMAAVRRWIDAAPGIDVHFAPSLYVDGRGARVGGWTCPLPPDTPLDPQTILPSLLVQNFVSVPAPVVRRQAWIDCGGMADALWYTADWDLWLKLAAGGRAIYHPEYTTAFRVHGSSLTVSGSTDAAGFRAQMEAVFDAHLGRLDPAQAREIEPLGRASIDVNVALAAAARGDMGHLAAAIRALLALGPSGLGGYLRASRLHERVFARIRARLAGGF